MCLAPRFRTISIVRVHGLALRDLLDDERQRAPVACAALLESDDRCAGRFAGHSHELFLVFGDCLERLPVELPLLNRLSPLPVRRGVGRGRFSRNACDPCAHRVPRDQHLADRLQFVDIGWGWRYALADSLGSCPPGFASCGAGCGAATWSLLFVLPLTLFRPAYLSLAYAIPSALTAACTASC